MVMIYEHLTKELFQPLPCVPTHCVDPPLIDGMVRHWDGRPVNFHESVEYTCQPGGYFEAGREVKKSTITCNAGGYFDLGVIKLCFETVYCNIDEAPETPEGG